LEAQAAGQEEELAQLQAMKPARRESSCVSVSCFVLMRLSVSYWLGDNAYMFFSGCVLRIFSWFVQLTVLLCWCGVLRRSWSVMQLLQPGAA
jgi:hypothetical protein